MHILVTIKAYIVISREEIMIYLFIDLALLLDRDAVNILLVHYGTVYLLILKMLLRLTYSRVNVNPILLIKNKVWLIFKIYFNCTIYFHSVCLNRY